MEENITYLNGIKSEFDGLYKAANRDMPFNKKMLSFPKPKFSFLYQPDRLNPETSTRGCDSQDS